MRGLGSIVHPAFADQLVRLNLWAVDWCLVFEHLLQPPLLARLFEQRYVTVTDSESVVWIRNIF